MLGGGAGGALALSAGLCADAGRFCQHACPLGSLMARRCVNLQLASAQDAPLKRRQRVLLPCFKLQVQILRCLCESRRIFSITELVSHFAAFFATTFALLAFATVLQRGLGTASKHGAHVCSGACHFVQCFVQ